jgi:DNA-binding LacI/PurR family transcriptional regulator
MRAVRELDYRVPRPVATEPLRSIGLILPHSPDELLLHPFFPLVMRGVSRFAQPRGYVTTYAFSDDEDDRLELIERYVHSSSVRGLILLSVYQNDRCVDALVREDFPFVVIGRPEHPGDLLWVDNDNFHAMYDVVNRLVEAGNRRIAFVGGPVELNVTRDRLEGYRMALANRGLHADDGLVGHAAAFSESAGYRAMAGVLGRTTPDAFVATDDLLGFGALQALEDRGLGPIPCVGFNNSRLARERNLGLSSVEIRPEELGHHAARLLVGRLEHDASTENHVIVPTLFVSRETA